MITKKLIIYDKVFQAETEEEVDKKIQDFLSDKADVLIKEKDKELEEKETTKPTKKPKKN